MSMKNALLYPSGGIGGGAPGGIGGGAPTPSISGPTGGGGFGSVSPGVAGGIAGGMMGALSGLPGLGAIGSAIGTGFGVANANTGLAGMNVPGRVSFAPALASNLTFGAFGEDPQSQALSAVEADPSVQAQAEAESAVGIDAFGGPGESVGGGGGGSSDGGDSCVVTSQLVASGIWPERNRREYVAYCRKFKHDRKLGEAQRRGYLAWGKPLVRLMRRWPAAATVGKWLAEAYHDEIRRRMGAGSGSLRGHLVAWTLEPVSALIGLFRAGAK